MLTTIIILFALAAVFGLTILIPLLKGQPTPKLSVVLHGLFAATALILLIVFEVNNMSSPTVSTILFVIAAIGGFILLANDLKKKPGPKALALIHAGAAVIVFLILLVFALA
jgi:hypothetical protein